MTEFEIRDAFKQWLDDSNLIDRGQVMGVTVKYRATLKGSANEVVMVEPMAKMVETLGITTKPSDSIDLWYPSAFDEIPKEIRVGLAHVRAANDLLISYDFDRDGWVIKMTPTSDDSGMLEEIGPAEEIVFIDAWLER